MKQQNRLRIVEVGCADRFSLYMQPIQLLFPYSNQIYKTIEKTFYLTYNLTIDVDHTHTNELKLNRMQNGQSRIEKSERTEIDTTKFIFNNKREEKNKA